MLTKCLIDETKSDIYMTKYSCTKDDMFIRGATLSVCIAMLLVPVTIVCDILTGIFQLIYLLVKNCIWRSVNK